jgi:hypothetical protein
MHVLKSAAVALAALIGVGTFNAKAAELSVPYRIHHAHFARYALTVPDGFYYPPYGFWQHAPWGWDWHNWGARPWDWQYSAPSRCAIDP